MPTVKPLKRGSSSRLPRDVQANLDEIAVKGVDLENLGTHRLYRVGNDIVLLDVSKGAKTLTDIFDSEQHDFDPLTSGLTSLFTAAAIRELRGLTEGGLSLVNSNFSQALQTTTSNDWVTKTGYPFTFGAPNLPAGTYVIDFTCIFGIDSNNKEISSRAQWKPNSSGTWIDLQELTHVAGSTNDGDITHTAFREVVLPSDDGLDVRWQFGQTISGGTGRISSAGFKIAKKDTT